MSFDFCSNQRSSTVLKPEDLYYAGLQSAQTIHVKSGTDGHNNITARWKHIPIEPEGFPNQPFYPVSADSFPGFFLHTDSQTVGAFRVRQDNHSKSFPPKPAPKPIDALKLPGRCEQICFRETIPAQKRI